MWDAILEALLDTLKLLPFLLLLYILIELMEHNTRIGRASGALSGKVGPLVGGATGLVPMCGFSVMAAKLYERKYVTLGTLLAVFITTSDEAFLVLLLSDMPWAEKALSILSMCGIKLVLGAGIGYLADFIARRKRGDAANPLPMPEDVHGHEHGHSHSGHGGHGHDHADHGHAHACEDHVFDGDDHGDDGHDHGEGEFVACEHKHGKWSALSLYLFSPLRHALEVAAFILLVNVVFNLLFLWVGEETVIGFLQGSGYWYQPLICSVLGLVPNCASSVILAEVYAMGGISFGSCLAGLIVNSGLGYLVLFRNLKAWKRTLAIVAFMLVLGIALGYAVNAIELCMAR